MEAAAQSDPELADDRNLTGLFERIMRRERLALDDLYDCTSRLLFGLTLKILPDRTAAEETLLEVYADIWKKPGGYVNSTSPLQELLKATRARALARLGKKAQLSRSVLNVDYGEKTVAPALQKEATAQFAALAPMQREILDWAYCSGLSASEIAARIGSPLGAVKTHVRIGLNRLRQTPAALPEPAPPESLFGDYNEGDAP